MLSLVVFRLIFDIFTAGETVSLDALICQAHSKSQRSTWAKRAYPPESVNGSLSTVLLLTEPLIPRGWTYEIPQLPLSSLP
jgi:hypothetical protein